MDYSQIATLPNLQPGSTGADVKKLQTWLIQNGFNIPDGATGNYGPETKAAVTQWQQTSGIDTQGNPGYFGPLSKAYIQKQGQPQTQTQTNQGIDQAGIDALHFMGYSDAQIASMSSTDRKNFAMTGEYLKKQADLGQVTAENNAASLQKAFIAATNDPNIVAKYGDIQKADTSNFLNTLNAFQTSTDVDTANQKLAFQKQQKDLADQAAACWSGVLRFSWSGEATTRYPAIWNREEFYFSDKTESTEYTESSRTILWFGWSVCCCS